MNTKALNKGIGFLWIVASVLKMIGSAYQLLLIAHSAQASLRSSDRIASGFEIALAFLSLIGGVGVLLGKNGARILILCMAVVYLLFGTAFILFGGFEDSTPTYSAMILFLCLLSMLSLFTLWKRQAS